VSLTPPATNKPAILREQPSEAISSLRLKTTKHKPAYLQKRTSYNALVGRGSRSGLCIRLTSTGTPKAPSRVVTHISLQAHHHPPADASAFQALFFLGRRWPSGIPSNRAFCLRAPGVRLSALETVLTGVLFLECCLSSFTSARVQSRRTTGFRVAAVLAINLYPFFHRL
jgi:hypothetical protein